MPCARIVAIVGAESTGKTRLAEALRQSLTADGRRVGLVTETLREFCDQHGRTPRIDEQEALAQAHSQRINDAAASHDLVIADTTALMTAVYSEQVFQDRSLYAMALQAHRACHVTLLTAVDLPWQADGLQRDGPQVREPVDTLIRATLQRAQLPFSVVMGAGPARLANAMAAVMRSMDGPPSSGEASQEGPWHWQCERCGDANCERRLLPKLC